MNNACKSNAEAAFGSWCIFYHRHKLDCSAIIALYLFSHFCPSYVVVAV